MTALTSVLADGPLTGGWHGVDWHRAHQQTRRLQVRIAKAITEGKHNKARGLQRLLTNSLAAKTLAVVKVTTNKGRNTPGIDGETWSTPQEKLQALKSLQTSEYRPKPLRRVYIPKHNGKRRPLGIPTMADRTQQALWALALDPVSETLADPHSYGFRKHRCCQDAMLQCFIVLSQKGAAQWILEADIEGCFDRLSHTWLLDNIPMDKRVLNGWLKAGYLERGRFQHTNEGTPQGGIISPILANMALDGLQAELERHFSYGGRAGPHKVHFVRYADDFIITGACAQVLQDQVVPLVKDFLAKRGLRLSQAKTRITNISSGFDFLGFNFRKYRSKFLIQPSEAAVRRLKEKIRDLLRQGRHRPALWMVSALNSLLGGWARYYQSVCSKRTFSSLDH